MIGVTRGDTRSLDCSKRPTVMWSPQQRPSIDLSAFKGRHMAYELESKLVEGGLVRGVLQGFVRGFPFSPERGIYPLPLNPENTGAVASKSRATLSVLGLGLRV